MTNDPDPVILDGIPPKLEQKPRLEQKRVLLASLFEISGMLANAVVGQVPPEGGIYYYINDHLGTPQRIIDQNGAVVWSGDYRPFGSVNAGVAEMGNSFRFAGQYYDSETGLHYNYHRYYDPALGRYLTPDPIGLAGGINPYVYVLNNPIDFVDPYGNMGPISYYRPVWKLIGNAQTPAIGGNVGGRPRTSGFFCACTWERIGYEEVSVDACGKTITEPVPSIFDPNNDFAYTPGMSTQGGCLCADPNGVLQLK